MKLVSPGSMATAGSFCWRRPPLVGLVLEQVASVPSALAPSWRVYELSVTLESADAAAAAVTSATVASAAAVTNSRLIGPPFPECARVPQSYARSVRDGFTGSRLALHNPVGCQHDGLPANSKPLGA